MSIQDQDNDALLRTRDLVAYLAELTDHSRRYSTADIMDGSPQAPEDCIWHSELPDDVVRPDPRDDDLLLRIKPVTMIPPPALPAELIGWVIPDRVHHPGHPKPALLPAPLTADAALAHDAEGDDDDERRERAERQRTSRQGAFDKWFAIWEAWAEGEPARLHRQRVYERVMRAARLLEQRDDEYEFVMAAGFLSWEHPDRDLIRRHLVVEKVHPKAERSGAVTLRRTGTRRLEDHDVLYGLEHYHPERAREAQEALQAGSTPIDSQEAQEQLDDWVGLAVGVACERGTAWSPSDPPLNRPRIQSAPAFLLRPRTKVLIAEAYRAIAAALEESDSDIPVGLAQIVTETDQPTRERWLAARNAARGDVLGQDPLFPLASNTEQSRVMELLRTETGIVVQGPPGTGKTHTIANLISALLARGQRVLVTSQKDQALRVLREKIPAPLQQLCVLLAGGSRDAAAELEQGIEALSAAIASTDERDLKSKADALSAERVRLLQRAQIVNEQVEDLRAVERKVWKSVVPEYEGTTYEGTLAGIVRKTRDEAADFVWMPPVPSGSLVPPLSREEFRELAALVATESPERSALIENAPPPADKLPTNGELRRIFADEQAASAEPPAGPAACLMDTAEATLDILQASAEEYQRLIRTTATMSIEWSRRAVDDLVSHRKGGLWRSLLDVGDQAGRVLLELNQNATRAVEVVQPVAAATVAETQHRITVGDRLLNHLRGGGKLRSRWPVPKPQKDAEPFLAAVLVDGRPPETVADVEAALVHLRAEVASIRLADRWTELGVDISADRLRLRLSELADHASVLSQAIAVSDTIEQFRQALQSLPIAVRSLDDFRSVADAIPGVRRARAARDATRRVEATASYLRDLVGRDVRPHELSALADAVTKRDAESAEMVLRELARLRSEHARELRCRALAERLYSAHPALLERIRQQPSDVWADRDIAAAWAWSHAAAFVEQHRTVAEERQLVAEYTQLTDQLSHVTGELVAAEALRACLGRLTDEHTRALNTYRELMSKVGAGTGRKAADFRKAARVAMEKARDAVPAWVVPLGNLLENLPAHRDRFDVVIVDEASQVGIEHLYLLWMAPRVIVVGDDKQCTPGVSGMGTLDEVFDRQRDRLARLEEDIRTNLTPKSNLYGVLSARAGKNGLVRLREHFRCVPEIIRWSSDQFYAYGSGQGGLIPLRERRADDLAPLQVVTVEGGVLEGRDARRRNPVEARELIELLKSCLTRPEYKDKTFGVVVLASAPLHVQLIERLIGDEISVEDRESRKIRVGTAPNFQGDERDVVFLTTVVTGRPHLARSQPFQQAFNVAVSRARDQLWLVTSLKSADLNPGDLRASLLAYMSNPPSVYGQSPALESVPANERVAPFDSLFEQRVFRAVKARGFHVVPQFAVGSRTLDLVVAGAGGRIAVECDGDYWHSGVDQQANDARRDSELARMGWETMRIRESEFVFDADRELGGLWQLLKDRGIGPGDLTDQGTAEWQPVELDDDEENTDD
ncbi:AAA domain-containing protein [Kribbella sp. NPDC005582]|uniref:AAA domain-containing protein n=1 Tax=Kribbella sp. NPDC005582 TaxID=3156893 RepID=UPI00339F58DF